MKTKTINLYSFDELSEEAKQKAIERLSDINVDFDWWDDMYEDAATIGLKITGFDIDRGSYVNGEFTLSANEVAQNIFNNHGESCETYKTARSFMDEWEPVFANYLDETHEDYESSDSEETMIELETRFLSSLCLDYLQMLIEDYEYATSKEAIIETIQANEYDFTEDGKLA